MKTLLIMLLLSFHCFAKDEKIIKPQEIRPMDYGDKQLLDRDTCRKPIEALETKYPNVTKVELEKMKKKCEY